jgi:hypothetical protein
MTLDGWVMLHRKWPRDESPGVGGGQTPIILGDLTPGDTRERRKKPHPSFREGTLKEGGLPLLLMNWQVRRFSPSFLPSLRTPLPSPRQILVMSPSHFIIHGETFQNCPRLQKPLRQHKSRRKFFA